MSKLGHEHTQEELKGLSTRRLRSFLGAYFAGEPHQPQYKTGDDTLNKLNTKWRELCKKIHPDKGGDTATFQGIHNIWLEFKRRFGKESWDKPFAGPFAGESPGPYRGWSTQDSTWTMFDEEDEEAFNDGTWSPGKGGEEAEEAYDSTDEPSEKGWESWRETEPGTPPSTSQSQGFSQQTPPKSKKPKVPEWVKSYLSTNIGENSMQSAFVLIVPSHKVEKLTRVLEEGFNTMHDYRGWYKEGEEEFYLVALVLSQKSRFKTFKCKIEKLFSVSNFTCFPIQAKKCLQLMAIMKSHLNGCHGTYIDSMGKAANGFNQILLNEFALSMFTFCKHKHPLYGLYFKFATPIPECDYCQKDKEIFPDYDKNPRRHYTQHAKHYENAKLFKANAQNAMGAAEKAIDHCRGVRAAELASFNPYSLSRFDQFKQFWKGNLDKLIDSGRVHGFFKKVAAANLLNDILPLNTDAAKLWGLITDVFVDAYPKKRCLVFQGPPDCGKTTLGWAITDFMAGVNLNVNHCGDNLRFEMGRAIGQFAVIFEDVKGIRLSPHDDLVEGEGMRNLTLMNDFIEGRTLIGLEKKHQGKVEQLFPPSIITMNHFKIPQTIKNRVRKILNFAQNKDLKFNERVKDEGIDLRTLSTGPILVLMFVLHCEETVMEFFGNEYKDDIELIKALTK